MTGQIPNDHKVLARLFSNRSISTDRIAFYNSPAFLAPEQSTRAFSSSTMRGYDRARETLHTMLMYG